VASTRTPRSSWIDAGLRALAAGPDAVRIDPLARALGVTKGGFYWHFDDRQALLEEMLDTWERVGVDEVTERVEGQGGDARARLRRLFALASSSLPPITACAAAPTCSSWPAGGSRPSRVGQRARRRGRRRGGGRSGRRGRGTG
jgi:AcrR family transcriptional regulator